MLGFEWRGGEWVSSLEATPPMSGFLHASSYKRQMFYACKFLTPRPPQSFGFALLEYYVHILVFTKSFAVAWPIKISLKAHKDDL
jgi:hypothetical protein